MTHTIIGENRKYSFKEKPWATFYSCFNVVLTSAKFKFKKLNLILQDRQVVSFASQQRKQMTFTFDFLSGAKSRF